MGDSEERALRHGGEGLGCRRMRLSQLRSLRIPNPQSRIPASQNSTFGASRTAALSSGMSSSAASEKLNMPATMFDGNTSRLLL
jgi:hypothetical protein